MKGRRKISKKKKVERAYEELEKKSYEELLEEKKSVESLLASLEDDYREAVISEEAYLELKEKNLERLKKLEKLIKEKGRGNEVKVEELPKPQMGEEELRKLISSEVSASLEKVVGKFNMELERLKVLIDTIKEGKTATDERLHMIGEQISELRTINRQLDARVREWEVKLEKFSDIVAGLELKKITREFEKIDKNFKEQEMRIEKVETLFPVLREKVEKVEKQLKEIGSIENLLTVMKEIDVKLREIERIGEGVGRTSEKIERIYIELNKKLGEFTAYRDKQDRMAELLNDLMKSVEDLNAKIGEYAKRSDLDTAKEMLEKRMESMRAEIEELIPEVIKELRKEEESIKSLLEELEKNYEEGVISEKEYKTAKEKNLERLKEIEIRIRKTWEEIRGGRRAVEVKRKEKVEKREDLIAELEDLFRKGLISKEAYERSRKILLGS